MGHAQIDILIAGVNYLLGGAGGGKARNLCLFINAQAGQSNNCVQMAEHGFDSVLINQLVGHGHSFGSVILVVALYQFEIIIFAVTAGVNLVQGKLQTVQLCLSTAGAAAGKTGGYPDLNGLALRNVRCFRSFGSIGALGGFRGLVLPFRALTASCEKAKQHHGNQDQRQEP